MGLCCGPAVKVVAQATGKLSLTSESALSAVLALVGIRSTTRAHHLSLHHFGSS
jgi:hypothetical protein